MTRPRVDLADLRTMGDEIRRRSYAFNRRPGARNNRGRIPTASGGGAAPAATWLSALGTLAWWVRPDMGYTMGMGVAAWADQSGNGVNFLQGTGSAQPALLAADLDGYSAVRGDGANDLLAAVWARAAPGTQPFYVRVICKQVGWTAGRIIYGDLVGGVGFANQQLTASPNLTPSINATQADANAAGTVGSYFRHELYFNNTTGSYHKVGATNATGGTFPNGAGGGTMCLFAFSAGAYGNVAIVEAAIYLGTPDAGRRAALDAIDAAKYPSAGF